jgi:hypothetical protein
MHHSKTHIAFRFLLLLGMFAASTGFTAIVSYCTMSGESECCCGSDHAKATPINGQQQISDDTQPCLLKSIAGGLVDIRATLTSENSGNAFFFSIELFSLNTGHLSTPLQETHFTFSGFDTSPPPGDDLYIQHHSYLI